MKKRFLSLMIALAMMVGVFTPLIASANNGTEPVTVPTGTLSADQLSATKPEKTVIDIYKLTTQQSYKAGAPWEHTGGKIENTKILGTDVKPLEGAKFTFYKIKGDDDKENEKILALLEKNKAKFTTVDDMKKLLADGTGVTGLEASEKDADLKQITAGKLALAEVDGLTNGETAATTAEGLATVKLPDGYYWAIESHKPDKVTGQIAVPFALTLPLMNGKDVKKGQETIKAGTQYLSKLYIYPKNLQTNDVKIDKNHANYNEKEKKWFDKDGNVIEAKDLGAEYEKYSKEKKTISAQLGEDRRFDSKTEIPRNYTFTEFSWSDIMSEGLTYNKGSLKVTMEYTDDQNAKKTETFIDLTAAAKINEGFVTENNNGFDIDVVKAGDAKNPQPAKYTETEKTMVENIAKYLKNGPVTFHFSYNAKVNNNTVVDKPQSNSITFEPGKPDGGGKVKSKDQKISIEKSWKNKAGENQDNPTATDITYYLLDAQGKTVASVTVKAGTAENTVIQAGKGITFKVGNKLGSGTFEGLPADAEYTVREAVAGYKPTYTAGTTDGKLNIENKDTPEVKKPTEPKIVFHGKKFVKMDQIGDARLFGAQFVIRNKSTDANNADKDKFLVVKSEDKKVEEIDAVKKAKENLDDKIDEYNNLTAEQQKAQKSKFDTDIDGLQKTYNDAVIAARTAFTWEAADAKGNPPENAYKLSSDGQGRFEITGLSAGKYELVETKAPVGYAKLETPVGFEVKDESYTKDSSTKAIHYNKDAKQDAQKDALRVDNKKVTIPQTGGIGTIIFTAIGLAIMASAVIAIKKRQATEAR